MTGQPASIVWAVRFRHFQDAASACAVVGDHANHACWRAAMEVSEDCIQAAHQAAFG